MKQAMKTQHLFLSRTAPLPERLREAFPDVQALAAMALQARCGSLPATQCLVWLSGADALWPTDLSHIRQIQAGVRVVLLSGAPEPREGLNALNQGVRGYAHAYAVPSLLQEVALVVEHGGLWVGPELLQRLVGASNAALARRPIPESVQLSVAADAPVGSAWAALSAREAQVARAVSAGRSNKEVATQLFISERTVKAHLSAVFEKLGVRDRLQLVLRLAASAAPLPSITTEALV
jgi:DNA-binding NarL/FixJ family response regulator